jgi:hypothetical protein
MQKDLNFFLQYTVDISQHVLESETNTTEVVAKKDWKNAFSLC